MEEEAAKAAIWMRITMGILVLFGVMMFKSCEEIKYKISGQQVNANFQGFTNQKGRRGGESLHVKYSFLSPDGESVRGASRVPLDWSPTGTNNTVEVTYLKGDPEVNKATAARKSWPIFVLLGLLVMGVLTALKFNHDVNAEMSSGKQRR